MTEPAKPLCKSTVWRNNGNWGRRTPCRKTATKDGYCGVHHPEAKARRNARWDKKYQEDRVSRQASYDRHRYDEAAGNYCRAQGFTLEFLQGVPEKMVVTPQQGGTDGVQ